MLPQVASQGLARYCDVFCEREAFSVPESRRILLAARDLGLGTRIHAEQITRSGASQLAAEVGARSADHLEKVSHEDVEALAAAGVIGVLLPGASLVLRTPPAPARQLIDGGVTVALSTDWNPGTCPSPDLPLMAALGCYHLGMTAEEALAGITWSAARALGLGEDRGRLRVGDRGDLSIHAVADWREMVFGLGQRTCVAAVKDGTVAWQRGDRAL